MIDPLIEESRMSEIDEQESEPQRQFLMDGESVKHLPGTC